MRLRPLRSSVIALFAILVLIAFSVLLISEDAPQLNQRISVLPNPIQVILNATWASNTAGKLKDFAWFPFSVFDSNDDASDDSDSFALFSDLTASSETLSIASNIYVVSLARRLDRRAKMERIRRFLDLRWDYVDALDKLDGRIDWILNHVKQQRASMNGSFHWPQYLLGTSHSYLYQEVDSWASSDVHRLKPSNDSDNEYGPLLCATEDMTIPDSSNLTSIPYHLVLSRGMIACWHSHMAVIRRIAGLAKGIDLSDWDGKRGVAIVFEDDIDVETDLRERLVSMWRNLTKDWDIVFFGHCWSNESTYTALTPSSPLHPSFAPKCTHAYALSPRGATRLLAYLSYPPFAYSRALDQAIAHLIQSGRLKSFSVVPSVVIQQKSESGLVGLDEGSETSSGDSDIWETEARGSKWRETLVNSVLQGIERPEGNRPRSS